MPRTSDKRERLIQSADNLILQRGFKQTTLADIAEDSGVPLGNVYYYFKTKEDIGKTIIETRLSNLRQFLARCSEASSPRNRLLAFLDYPSELKATLTSNGCPLGTLSYELSRNDTYLRDTSRELIRTLLDWSTAQFSAMGVPDPEALGLQFICNLQGMSLVANTLQQAEAIDTMVERTRTWIQSI